MYKLMKQLDLVEYIDNLPDVDGNFPYCPSDKQSESDAEGNTMIAKQCDNYEVISVTAAPFDVSDEVKDKLEVFGSELTDDELKYAIIGLNKQLMMREEEDKAQAYIDNGYLSPQQYENALDKAMTIDLPEHDENSQSF